MIEEHFKRMSTKEQDTFRSCINKLLRVNYIIREVYNQKEQEMKINYEFSFIERNFTLFEDYLEMGGWRLHKDSRFGVIYIETVFEYNRYRMKKFSTMALLTLRLIYDEERERLALKKEILLTVHTMIIKMINLGLIDKKPSNEEIKQTMNELQGFGIVDKVEGNWQEAETKFLIYPSILFVLTNAKLNELYMLIEEEEKCKIGFEMEEQMAFEEEVDEDL